MPNTELLRQEIRDLNESVKTLREDVQPLIEAAPKLADLVEAYDSVLFGKKFVVGLASIVGSIAAIGGAILWIISYIRHGAS